MTKRPEILAVHQGYELYGSDRTFISSVTALRDAYPDHHVSVLLPRSGPLADALEGLGFAVTITPIWVARRADGIWRLLLGVLLFPIFVCRAWLAMRGRALCYINTAVVFDFAVAARFSRRPSIIHVHEMPQGRALDVIRAVLRFSGSALVFNSAATRTAFAMPAEVEHYVLLNGVADPGTIAGTREDDGRLRVLMIGRINDWKGQDLLVQAVSQLPEGSAKRLDIHFAGAAFEDGPAVRRLKALLARAKLAADIRLLGFVADPAPLYRWCDVVVVPSKRPEPFGLVAVEAMSHGREVLAAGHGGVGEIVVDGATGWLFAPRDPAALAQALERALQQPGEIAGMGRAGRRVYLARFTEARYQAGLVGIVDHYLGEEHVVPGALHAA